MIIGRNIIYYHVHFCRLNSRCWISWPLTGVTNSHLPTAVKTAARTKTNVKSEYIIIRSTICARFNNVYIVFIVFLDNDSVDSVSSAVQDSDQDLTIKSK